MLVLRSNDYYCLNACISLGDVIIIVKLLVKCVTNEPCSVTSCESLLCSLLFQYALSALWACASYNGTSTQAVGASTQAVGASTSGCGYWTHTLMSCYSITTSRKESSVSMMEQ